MKSFHRSQQAIKCTASTIHLQQKNPQTSKAISHSFEDSFSYVGSLFKDDLNVKKKKKKSLDLHVLFGSSKYSSKSLTLFSYIYAIREA